MMSEFTLMPRNEYVPSLDRFGTFPLTAEEPLAMIVDVGLPEGMVSWTC
jgi:hypothetical protein